MSAIDISNALQILTPGAQWVLSGSTYAGLTWLSGSTPPEPTSTQVNNAIATYGPFPVPSPITVTSNYLMSIFNNIILSNGAITITLPSAIGIAGQQFTIKRIYTAGNTSVATLNSQLIDGAAAPLVITVNYSSVNFISDGTNWNIT